MFLETLSDSLQFEGYVDNREKLITLIKKKYPDVEDGLIVLFGGFEKSDIKFRQESSFYFFSGITEPGIALIIDMNGGSQLFIPNCYEERAKWCGSCLQPSKKRIPHLGLESIELLGENIPGYTIHPYFPQNAYENLLKIIKMKVKAGGKLFVLNPNDSFSYVEQRFVLNRIQSFIPELSDNMLIDISPLVTQLRRKKSIFDIEKISDAIDLTIFAHGSVAKILEKGLLKSEVRGTIEYLFTAADARPAFPSIVAAGKHGTILHCVEPNAELADGQLVIVDIGADVKHYCADITRTYPVSKKFTDRQKEIYTAVLETQKYIADIVKPGYFLLNKEDENKSLNHLARKFLKKRGFDQYFTHGIGHFLGLDVHDVGDITKPLEEGDVITIEPGIYIPEEEIGIRIEDDYWITKDKAVCLSDILPKEIEEVEAFLQNPEDFDFDEDFN